MFLVGEKRVGASGQLKEIQSSSFIHDEYERFIGFLIEHYAGNFPLWLAPEQVRVLTLSADDNLIADAKDSVQELRAAEVRITSDLGS
jgi:threonyl-tRNA synthetase